ncbi:MAG: metal ABC transporter permease [Planctomycetota bacterium]|jgi:manganese/zinc/iron transport system permease protein
MDIFLQLDLPAILTAAFAAMACAIAGCFLVLRRMSLMGDAISHAVLPGIVATFVFWESLQALPVFIGCAIVGVLTAFLSELIHRLGRVEPGASMGIVFTVLFAIGVIWLNQVEYGGSGNVHIDADCVLYGDLQGVTWLDAPERLIEALSPAAWMTLPRQVVTLAIVLVFNIAFVALLFKELRITAFDPGLAAAQGIPPALMHYMLMTVVAMTTVAAFEAVGSILVVAMLIVPGLVAHLLTDRLVLLIPLSAVVACFAAVGGYSGAAAVDVNPAGMMGVVLGAILLAAGLLAPRNGWIARLWNRAALATSILREDMLGLLFRASEHGGPDAVLTPADVRHAVGGGMLAHVACWRLRARSEARLADGALHLTSVGAGRAATIVRSHRLWESFLVDRLGLRPDHVHGTATTLEHLTSAGMRDALARSADDPAIDPHGRTIPGEAPDATGTPPTDADGR